MTQILLRGDIFNQVGCTDPLAVNYDPMANTPCLDCCTYGIRVIGCTDPLAFNYNSTANISCTDCCLYATMVVEQEIEKPRNIGNKPVIGGDCVGPYRLEGNEFFGVEGVQCCTSNNRLLGLPPLGYQYYWDGSTCKIIPVCPTNTTCVSCDNFNWWNSLYITNHNGQSLSVTSPILWQQIVDLVTNNGETISVNTLNGDLVTQDCCKGVFKEGICYCQQVTEESYEPRCISNIGDFLNLISTPIGYDFFINNFSTIGPSLGLTLEETNFIKLNINSTADVNNNGIKDLTDSRLTLSNALNVTGGFYVNFGTLTNTPILVTQSVCTKYGGYWDGTNCMCDPVIDQCDIGISQVQIINSFDVFNNPIQIVTSKEGRKELGEACCNRLIKDNPNLNWVWQSPYCLASPKEDCLPAVFTLNNELMKVPPCGTDLELSMWVYFEKPENPCQPIPDPPDIDIITIDGQACDITLSPNTRAVNNTLNQSNIYNADSLLKGITQTNYSSVITDARSEIGVVNTTPKVCCYNTNNPIVGRISTTEPSLNQFLNQVIEYNSSVDYFGRWVQIKATLPTSGLTLNFGLNLEITQGLNCCCDYNFFIDDIQVNCVEQVPSLIYNNIQCPGFNLTRVIDNKKSWAYNPGISSVGISEYDKIERADGSFGMLNGEGTINRTFAPSLDADIPWRYTDYWQQSSVYEKHSNLVLNSKELWLTFDMCADCPVSTTTLVCPQGYTLSANTQICYQEVKLFQDGSDFIFMNGDNYIFQ